MGKQYNKVIKKKRRLAYLERKKNRVEVVAAKPASKAAKSAKPAKAAKAKA